jgi:putative hydrolase of the HAD superfamily
MKYKAVIFDLFGTLVDNFKRREYDVVNAKMAKLLNIPFTEFWQLVAATGRGYYLGQYKLFEDNLEDICGRWGIEIDTNKIIEAAKYHYGFITDKIIPSQKVLGSLEKLRARGLRIGLITNCGAAVPLLWEKSPLVRLIDVAVFSCQEHDMKPSIDIYQTAAERLQIAPEACIFVGDGSNQELTNASAVGMQPILRRASLDDVYDKHRPEVASWSGLVIDEIGELIDRLNELEG